MVLSIHGNLVTISALKKEIHARIRSGVPITGWVSDAILCLGADGKKMVEEVKNEIIERERARSKALQAANRRPRVWVF